MTKDKKPELFILSGPNGAGKTTVADFLLQEKGLQSYVNADTIAKGLDRGDESTGDIKAGRVMLNRLHQAIDLKESIAFETTLSGKLWVNLIQLATSHGFEITLCYVAVQSVEISIDRVRRRAAEGGHFIKESDLRRRFPRTISGFFHRYSSLANSWYFFDNSGESAVLVALRENGDNTRVLDSELYEYYKELAQK